MTYESTATKLNEMRLGHMAEAFKIQLQDISMNELTFAERFGMLIDSEWDNRKSNRVTRLLRQPDSIKITFRLPKSNIIPTATSTRDKYLYWRVARTSKKIKT